MDRLLLKWVRENGLPSLGEIQLRIDAVRLIVGPPFEARTILVALLARDWRWRGCSRGEIAQALFDPMLGITSQPIGHAAAEARVKRAEAMLRRLERAEGKGHRRRGQRMRQHSSEQQAPTRAA